MILHERRLEEDVISCMYQPTEYPVTSNQVSPEQECDNTIDAFIDLVIESFQYAYEHGTLDIPKLKETAAKKEVNMNPPP